MSTLVTIGIAASIFMLVFCLGLRTRGGERFYLLKRPGLLVRSLVSMLVVMPLVAAGLAVAFDLHPAMKIALIALAVSPVPPILPRKEIKAGGTTEYALGLLVAAVLVSILFTPAAVNLLGAAFGVPVDMPVRGVLRVVTTTVLLPLALGLATRHFAPRFADRAEKPLSMVGIVLLLVCLVPVVIGAWPAIVATFRTGTVLAIVLFCVAGFLVGHLLGGPIPENRTVLAMSTATRHPGVAIAIGSLAFPEQNAVGAAVVLVLLVNAAISAGYLAVRRRTEGSAPHPGGPAIPSH